ncbi:MAG: DUF707 domain-containing protein [Hymenobacter sp.]
MGQVEVMAPLFSQDALRQCLVSFNENKSSWGLDSVWPKILGYPQNKLGVFDAVVMEHTRPVGGASCTRKLKPTPTKNGRLLSKSTGPSKTTLWNMAAWSL